MRMIFSADNNWGIGKDNQLLFRIPPDMKHFKENTWGGAVIMGRKTLDSLPGGRPLPGRVNLVLSTLPQEDFASRSREPGDLWICGNLEELKQRLSELNISGEKTWVIGGEKIYRLLLPYCQEAYVTRFYGEKPADSYMVNLDRDPSWRLAEAGERQKWEELEFSFNRYCKVE